MGAHVSVDDLDWEWDSGYGGSTQGHGREYEGYGRPGPSTAGGSGGRERAAERRRAARSDDSHMMRVGREDWEKKRWGMDSETSFETASNVRTWSNLMSILGLCS